MVPDPSQLPVPGGQPVTSRRVVLYAAATAALAYVLACGVILHTANWLDYRRGWYDR